MKIFEMLQRLVELNGSDLHIMSGFQPTFRVDGALIPVEGTVVLSNEGVEELINDLLTQEQRDYILINKELDFGYQFKDQGRFRINVYYQQGSLAAALRLVPSKVRTIDELLLPPIFHQFTQIHQGLVLLTGPTGEGKSTSLAAMIEEINMSRAEHILTIEDPIEFVYQPKQSIISQREIQQDTHGWDIALKSALREDPDVVLVGEMRDKETIAATMTIAETGHLVLATLHTNSAAQTIDRIIDVFPEHQQAQIRQQLASTLQAVVSQRLVPLSSGKGRVPATEILIGTPAVRNLIREAKVFQLDNVMQTSGEFGMSLMEASLLNWVKRGALTMERARDYALRPEEFDRLAKNADV